MLPSLNLWQKPAYIKDNQVNAETGTTFKKYTNIALKTKNRNYK